MFEKARSQIREQGPVWPVAIGRVLIGLLWLGTLRWKLPPDFAPATGRGMMDWMQLEAQYPAFEFYGRFVESVVLPNFTLFAWITFLSELLIGLGLLTGTLTRFVATAGLVMSVNLGIGLLEVPGEWPWSYMMMAMWHGLFLVTAAGRVAGVDRWLRERFPESSPLRLLT
jgi:thiosulfate dehydrogenase [quinone] large subunit